MSKERYAPEPHAPEYYEDRDDDLDCECIYDLEPDYEDQVTQKELGKLYNEQ